MWWSRWRGLKKWMSKLPAPTYVKVFFSGETVQYCTTVLHTLVEIQLEVCNIRMGADRYRFYIQPGADSAPFVLKCKKIMFWVLACKQREAAKYTKIVKFWVRNPHPVHAYMLPSYVYSILYEHPLTAQHSLISSHNLCCVDL